MEKTPGFRRGQGADFGSEKAAQEVKPFYERPDGVDRNLTEVMPKLDETDDEFLMRASEELIKQYPDSDESKRKEMAESILWATGQQADSRHESNQREREALAYDEYKQKLDKLREDYRRNNISIEALWGSGILNGEGKSNARLNNREKYLNERKTILKEYEKALDEQVNIGNLQAEEVRQYRKKEMDDLNEQHEQMVNYEAERLGVSYGLDNGLITRLAEGDFSKESSAADFMQSVRRGMEDGSNMEEVEHFVNRLWEPELEVIKRNSIIRIVADPVRSKNVIGVDGRSHDESHFVLPIENQEFEEYMAENFMGDDGVVAMCAGLSKVLKYGTREEAIGRARWFYDLAHDKAGLDTDDILVGVEAAGIANGDNGNSKWVDRYNDFVAGVYWDAEEERATSQEEAVVEEVNIDTAEIKEKLWRKIQEYNKYYDEIGHVKKGGGVRSKDDDNVLRDPTVVNPIVELARDIVVLNRQLQHIEGTQRIIESLGENFEGLIEVGEPKYLNGAWATTRCNVSAFEIKSPASVGEVWAFVSEGTFTHEQDLYYGMTDSLDSIKKLFGGSFYRRSNMTPNIRDMNVFHMRHDLMPDDIRNIITNGWSEDDIEKLKGGTEYQRIAEYFADVINNGSYNKTMITKDEVGIAESTEDDRANSGTEVLLPEEEEDFEEEQPAGESNGVKVETQESQEKDVSQISDKDVFNELLHSSEISRRGRNAIRERYNNLRELARTPKKSMESMFSDADIREIARILENNGREHPKWLDE